MQHIKWVTELIFVFCHSLLVLCTANKTQTVSDERGEEGKWKCQTQGKTVKWHQVPGWGVCLPMCCLSSSIHQGKGQGTSGGVNVLTWKDGMGYSLDCLRQEHACPKLSVYGLQCNLPPVNAKFSNWNPKWLIAFKNKDHTIFLSSTNRAIIRGIPGEGSQRKRRDTFQHANLPHFSLRLMMIGKRLTGSSWPKWPSDHEREIWARVWKEVLMEM